MIRPVRLYGDPVLRKTAVPITTFDDDLKRLGEDLLQTMYHYNGVGLAGPQIGLAQRIFAALHVNKDAEEEAEDAPPPKSVTEKRKRWGVVAEYVMVNPKITHKDGLALDIEGCLSIPGIYFEEVERAEHITVSFKDTSGKPHELKAQGHFARVIQHELDHLNGVLFTDRLPDAERQSFMDEHRKALAEMQREAKAFLKELKTQKLESA